MENESANYEIREKWGEIVGSGYGGGFTAIPNLLLQKQHELEITSAELNVLMHLIRFWWKPTKMPFPDIKKIALDMGVSDRTAYRSISSLEDKGLIRRIKEGSLTKYDLSGLIDRLQEIKNAM